MLKTDILSRTGRFKVFKKEIPETTVVFNDLQTVRIPE
jgi:hypothetical protein